MDCSFRHSWLQGSHDLVRTWYLSLSPSLSPLFSSMLASFSDRLSPSKSLWQFQECVTPMAARREALAFLVVSAESGSTFHWSFRVMCPDGVFNSHNLLFVSTDLSILKISYKWIHRLVLCDLTKADCFPHVAVCVRTAKCYSII